jgi:hypothetical protein
VLPVGEKLGDEFRRILKISVNLYRDIAFGIEIVYQDRALKSKIARKSKDTYTRIAQCCFSETFKGTVVTRIIGEEELEIITRGPICKLLQPAYKDWDVFFLVEHRNAYGYEPTPLLEGVAACRNDRSCRRF